ncbi:MBL fold metallo-hydrolase [Streptomyces scabiei]|uniref:MBL fold metallo-hydrolase n=1 Tax=Streptomyces scabiei TaxID=1930 RepID=UPI003F4CEB55
MRHWDLTLTARAVVHDVEAYGLRAECRGRVFAYSGDSGPCEALSRLAGGADLFRCEADVDAHREGEPRVHLTPEEAGTYAKSASRLPIARVGPTLTREGATGRAAVIFGGPTESAREGDTRTV